MRHQRVMHHYPDEESGMRAVRTIYEYGQREAGLHHVLLAVMLLVLGINLAYAADSAPEAVETASVSVVMNQAESGDEAQ